MLIIVFGIVCMRGTICIRYVSWYDMYCLWDCIYAWDCMQLIQLRLTSTIVKWQMCNMHERKK